MPSVSRRGAWCVQHKSKMKNTLNLIKTRVPDCLNFLDSILFYSINNLFPI